MSSRAWISGALAVVLALVLCSPAHAGGGKTREAGPEDGISCCNGINPFLFDGDNVLVTTGRAGIFRSDHRGDKWQRSMEGFVAQNGVSSFPGTICQAPSKPKMVYALGGIESEFSLFNGVLASDDFGKSWTRRGEIDTGFGFNLCAVDADDARTVYVTGFDSNTFEPRTWRSKDGGSTFQEISDLIPACAVSGVVRSVPGKVYIGFDCLAVSTDGGASFETLPTPPGLIGSFDVRLDGVVIFDLVDSNFNLLGTFRSIDGGAPYVPVTGLPSGFGGPLGFDPTNASRVYAADGSLNVSQDGGLTFAPLPSDPRFLGVFPVSVVGVDPRGSVFIATQVAGPFRSDDGGNTYRSLIKEFRASAVQDLAFDADGKLLVGVLHTQVVFRETNGHKFNPLGTSLIDPNGIPGLTIDTASVAGSPTDPSIVLAATTGNFGLLRTDNGGASWANATVEGDPDSFFNSRISFATSSRVYVASPAFFAPGLYVSDDAGENFALRSDLPLGALAVDPTNSNTLYVGTYEDDTGLFKSTDGGQTLQPLGQAGDFSALLVDRRNTNMIFAGERLGQVLRSSDGGQTFAPASKGLAGAGVHGIAQDAKGTLYVWLRGGGLFSSKDGAKWKKVDSDEALQRSGVEAGRGTLVADPRHAGRLYLGNAGVIQVDDN